MIEKLFNDMVSMDNDFVGFFRDKDYIGTDANKYKMMKDFVLKFGGSLALIVIFLSIILSFNATVQNSVMSFICFLTWPFPGWFLKMRKYKYSLRHRAEERWARVYFFFAIYTLFIFLSSLVGFFMLIFGYPPIWLLSVLGWTSLVFFLPYFLIAIIAK